MIAGDDVDDDIFTASGSTPRFRGEGDWSETDFADFDDEPVHDEDSGELGALVDVPDVDDDELFAAEVAARRAPARRTRARAGAAASAGAYGASEPSAPRPSRPSIAGDDLTTRVITGVVLAVVGLLAFALGRAATAVLITAIVAVAAFELYEGFRRAGFQPATLIGLLGSAALVGIAYNYGERAFPLVSAVVIAFTLFWYLAKVVHARPDGELCRHHARLLLRGRARRLRRPPARLPRRRRDDHRPRHLRGRLRRRRLPRRHPVSAVGRSLPTCRRTRPSKACSRGWRPR